jgi:hypothetical protein
VRLHRGKRWLAAASAILACTGLVLSTSEVSYATATSQVCAQEGAGYCMNDWGGADVAKNIVAMYYNDNTNNNDFILQPVDGCTGPGGLFSCVEIMYQPSGGTLCVAGIAPSGIPVSSGDLGSCGNPQQGGNGAAYGVIQWQVSPSWCDVADEGLENRYWTQEEGHAVYVQSGGSIGASVNLAGSDHNTSSCWDQIG